MRVGFDAPSWVVAVTAIAYAFEPLALIHERLILAETVALFCLALFVLVGLVYIRQPRWYLTILLVLLGTIGLSLRTSFIPVVVIAAGAVVVLALPAYGKKCLTEKNSFGCFFCMCCWSWVALLAFTRPTSSIFPT